MPALWDWGCSLLAWQHAPACTRRIESCHIIRRLITSHLLSLILIITCHLFSLIIFIVSIYLKTPKSLFLYSFSFALMCLTHLLFSPFFYPLHYILSSFHFLSFSVYHPVYYPFSLFLSLLLSSVSAHTRPISFYQPTPVGSIIPSW